MTRNKLDLSFRAQIDCAKFYQNRLKIVTAGECTDRQTKRLRGSICSMLCRSNGQIIVPYVTWICQRQQRNRFSQTSRVRPSAVIVASKAVVIIMRFDYDTTTIRLRRIARACFRSTRFDASKKLTYQFSSSSYRSRIDRKS